MTGVWIIPLTRAREPPIIYFGVTTCHQRGRAAGEPPISASRSTRASSPRSIPHSRLLRVIVPRTSAPLSTACRPYNRLRLRRRSGEPSPVSERGRCERVPSELSLAWVTRPDWESAPEYRWVPSRVDERESRGISLIEKTGLPDQLTAVLLKQRLHFLQNSVR